MKLTLLALLALLLSNPWAFSQTAPELPENFTTKQGKTFQGAKLNAVTEDAIKFFHNGGIATIPFSQLPIEVIARLGVAVPLPDDTVVSLPDPFVVGTASYQKAELTGVDPDGIRIKHDLGAAKVPYQLLPQSVLAEVGPFDPTKAEQFKQAETERNLAALTAARQAREAVQAAATNAIVADQKALEAEKQALLADPTKVSPLVNVRITATSTGGKNRDTNWQTYYGSYDRTETSKRTMVCTIASRSGGFQRVRLQCLFLTRDVSGSRGLLYEIVADDLVNLGPMVTKTVVAGGVTQQTDENYVMLGLRVKEGAKYVGWTWRAIDGSGRICAVYSSAPAYDRYAWQAAIDSE